MEVTLSGMYTLLKLRQLEKAELLMVVTLLGMATLVRPEPENASYWMEVMFSGMMMLVRELQP